MKSLNLKPAIYRDSTKISEMAYRLVVANPPITDILVATELSSESPQQQLNNAVLNVLAVGTQNGFTLAHILDTLKGQAEMLDHFVEVEFDK